MPQFLFQPDPIDGYEFHPIPIDIHLGIIKIPIEEFDHDFAVNTTECVIIGIEREEILEWMQTHFAMEFKRYGKLKESEIRPMGYETKQAWKRIRKHIKNIKKFNL